jgi:hydrogenase maturation protease
MLTIIGCGNPNRSDDGVGVAVARGLLVRLGGRAPDGTQVFDAGTAGMEVMFRARGSRELIVVDASSSGSEAGAVFTLPGELLNEAPEPVIGLHGFRWDHAIYAGKKIFRGEFPDRVAVYLIEAGTLELGIGLSPPVERAAQHVIDLLLARVRAFSGESRGPDTALAV